MSLLLDISPNDLGLPSRFSCFRTTQAEAIDWFMASDKKFCAANSATGTGKSLKGVAIAKIAGMRAVYLTSTKGLQDQVLRDFASVGMVDVRGRDNYSCRAYTYTPGRKRSCGEGMKQNCHLSHAEACPYNFAVAEAKASEIVVTNYPYWLHIRRHNTDALNSSEGEPIALLICDEAHNAVEEIASFLRVFLPETIYADDRVSGFIETNNSGKMSEPTGLSWIKWAEARLADTRKELAELVAQYGSLREAKEESGERIAVLEELMLKCSAICSMDSNWVWEIADRGVTFDCIWPGRYAGYLWSNVERVLLLSATLRPYTLSLLGLAKSDYDYREFANDWPPNYGPIYYWPTVKMSYRATDEDYSKLVTRIDEIIESRLDRKGIIHTVSYSRMRRLLGQSRYAKYMVYNEASSEVNAAAQKFRAMKAPALLVSPSFPTGWDFSYTQCEYQILPKVPFPYSESRVMQERCRDEQYRIYCALMELTQMIGRGRRAHDDRCETFILDNLFPLAMSRGKSFLPKGMIVNRINSLPKRPKKLF